MEAPEFSGTSRQAPATPGTVEIPFTGGKMRRFQPLLQAALLLATLVGFSLWAIRLTNPPAPVPADAPPDQFSALRALAHVRVIATEPHPVGTPAHAAARAYLCQELSRLGLEAQEQATTALVRTRTVPVINVMARIPGTGGTGRAILLVAHYDSVPRSPGASDDASGVATLLETARALRAAPPLRHDVILLFSDAEEVGLFGARAFVQAHPWARDTALVLNFEARGHAGPVYTFETSPDNLWLVREYARAAPYPLASSLMYEIYRRLPNDTDFTVFRRVGFQGFNFAFIGGLSAYHGPSDTAANLDSASLQQDGSYALGLARHFGNLDFPPVPATGNAVYFNTLGHHLLVYSHRWTLPLALLATLAWFAVLLRGLRRHHLSVGRTLLGLACLVGNLLLAVGLSYLLVFLLRRVHPALRTPREPVQTLWYLGTLAGLLLAALSALQIPLRRWLGTFNLAQGGLLLWVLLALGTAIFVPGAAFLFTWPLLGALGSLALGMALPEDSLGRAPGVVLPLLPALALLVPLIPALYVALGLRMAWVAGVVMALLAGVLGLPFETLARPAKWALPALGLLAALACLVGSHLG
jgi:hypothetical protein